MSIFHTNKIFFKFSHTGRLVHYYKANFDIAAAFDPAHSHLVHLSVLIALNSGNMRDMALRRAPKVYQEIFV